MGSAHDDRIAIGRFDGTGAAPLAIDHAVSRSLEVQSAAANDAVARLVGASLALLREFGADFTVDDIVRQTGLSRRTFYRFFDTKDDLILAAFESMAAEREVRQREVVASSRSAVDRLHGVVRVRWDWSVGLSRPLAAAIATLFPALRAAASHRYELSVQHLRSLMAEVLDDCQESGSLRPSPLSIDERAVLTSITISAVISDRVLTLDPEHAVVPPDDAAFERLWSYLSGLLLAE